MNYVNIIALIILGLSIYNLISNAQLDIEIEILNDKLRFMDVDGKQQIMLDSYP